MDARLRLGIGDNLLDAVLGYLVVFIGLSLLMLVIIIVGKVMVAKSKKADNKSTAPAASVLLSITCWMHHAGQRGFLFSTSFCRFARVTLSVRRIIWSFFFTLKRN